MNVGRKQQLEEIMVRLGEINRLFATTRDEFLARFDLSRPQTELLYCVRHGKKTIGELASSFNVTPSAVSQMVGQLEEKKLVLREHDKEDRRIVYVELSRGTKSQFKKFRKELLKHLDIKFSDLDEEELNKLEKILTRITKTLGKESIWKE